MAINNPIKLRGRAFHAIVDAPRLEKKLARELKGCTFQPQINRQAVRKQNRPLKRSAVPAIKPIVHTSLDNDSFLKMSMEIMQDIQGQCRNLEKALENTSSYEEMALAVKTFDKCSLSTWRKFDEHIM